MTLGSCDIPGLAADELPPNLLARRLMAVAVPTLSAVMYGKGLRSRFLHGIRPAGAAAKFCGPAYTLRAIPVREDLRDATAAGRIPSAHRTAFDAAPAGCVVVSSTGGAQGISILGDIIATALTRRGVAGVVMDSGVSDLAAVGRMALPVFHGGGSAPVPAGAMVMVVDHGLPIGVAGVAVFPGDIMVGDENGVVCIPAGIVHEVLDAAEAKERLEAFILAEIEAGAPLEGTYPPSAATLARYRQGGTG
jgi:regulator of RNase E activity RraA